MSSRLIRTLLVVLAIAIGIAASYLLKTYDTRLNHERAAADGLRDQARDLASTLSNIRAGQIAYIARGQGEAFWMERVSKLLPVLDQRLSDFRASLASPAAQTNLEPALAAVENFHKLDARAQDYVKYDDPLLASDLIFSDGLEATATAITHVDGALTDELAARQAGVAALRRSELMALGGGAGAIALIVMLLGFTGARAPAEEVAPDIAAPEPAVFRDETGPDGVPLADAARLCSDLARVQDSKLLPGLIERAAAVLDASGVIVWVADAGGRELRPAMSFGYSDQVMARMGTISRDAANAVAAAYRLAQMRTVKGDGLTNGALVAPLVTPDGCIGVLSAETKGGSEKDERSQALASIVAAQLATLFSTPPAALDKAAANG